jgi:hypothetical protein
MERRIRVRLGGRCIPWLSFAQFRNITGYGGGLLQGPCAGVTGLMNFLSPALSGGARKKDHHAISAPLFSPSTRARLFVLKDARKSRTSEVGPSGSVPKAACSRFPLRIDNPIEISVTCAAIGLTSVITPAGSKGHRKPSSRPIFGAGQKWGGNSARSIVIPFF